MWWKILLIIFGLIFLFLIQSIHIIVRYDEKVSLYAGLGLIRLDILKLVEKIFSNDGKKKEKKPKKEESEKEKAEKKDEKEEKPKKPGLLSEITSLRGAEGLVDLLLDVIKLLGKVKRGFTKHIVFRKLNIYYCVSADDAAATAEKYGKMCAVLYPLIAVLTHNIKTKKTSTVIVSDFLAGKDTAKAEIHISYRLLSLISFALSALIGFLKVLFKQKAANDKARSKNEAKKNIDKKEIKSER